MKIGVVGLGLIGGSLCIDFMENGNHEVIAVSLNVSCCEFAMNRGIVHVASVDYDVLMGVDILFICTPLSEISSCLQRAIPYLGQNTIVTDVGSVKLPIVTECSKLWPRYIGGHPMAGTSNSGISAAIPKLFQNSYYVITPSQITNSDDVNTLKTLILQLGAIPQTCDAAVHDRAVSRISHLPVMVSATLINCCESLDSESEKLAKKLASSGFRDTSRVGGGNPELGTLMAQYNKLELLNSLQQYKYQLELLITDIETNNWDKIQQTLRSANNSRSTYKSCS